MRKEAGEENHFLPDNENIASLTPILTKTKLKGKKIMFLPDNYESPKLSNNYLKLKEGSTRIRIMSKPVLGWEDWRDKKPVRFHFEEKPAPIDPKKPVKHFWAFIVYNYNDNEVQIMQVTQSTIRRSLESFSKDADWGSPFEYDIKITKSGEGMETEYTVNPIPHKKISQELIEAFKAKPINLEALFDGSDPFVQGQGSYTKMLTEEKAVEESLEKDERSVLTTLLKEVDDESKKTFHDWIHNAFNANSIAEIPKRGFEKCMITLNNKIKYLKDQQKVLA